LLFPFGKAAADLPEAPAAGRPEDWSGLVGTYEITASARPTDLRALDPLTLTVRITETSGNVPQALGPERSSLRATLRPLGRDFYMEALPDLPQPTPSSWEFTYRLKPRRARVQKIPALKLSYFDPQYNRYQIAYSRSVPLYVKPGVLVEPPAEGRGGRAPDRFYELTTGPAVLRQEGGALAPSLLVLALLVLAPPSACIVWYVVWQRHHPDAARRARRQRSQAARHALRQLHRMPVDKNGAASAAVIADYLRCRLDLAAAEPTPAEILLHLRRAHVSAGVADQVGDFLRACDAMRFAPAAPAGGRQLAREAATIVLALEAEPCLSRPS